MKKNNVSPFGLRLKEVFNEARNKEIAYKLGVSSSAITTYLRGRVPPPETLVEISRLTGCSIHWLVTGEGSKWISDPRRFAESSAHTIVFANQKGGEAKSTSATLLAVEFSKRGYRTLLIDTPNGSSTFLLFSSLMSPFIPEKILISNMLTKLEMKGRIFFRTPFKGLDLCTSNERQQALLRAGQIESYTPNLSSIHKEYNFIVLDTDSATFPSNFIELFMASMITPVSVLIPTCGDNMALEGVKETLKQFKNAQRFASNLNIMGLFLTRLRYRNSELAKILNKLNKILPRQVLKTVVRVDAALIELGANGNFQLSGPRSHGFVAYSKLAEEILTLLGK